MLIEFSLSTTRGQRRVCPTAYSTAIIERLETRVLLTVPSVIITPVNATGWDFNQHPNVGAHTESGGIGGADDRYAYDCNLNTPSYNSDAARPVYAVADGWIERNISGWSGSSYGQLLLKHYNPDGSAYYTGYLHMANITGLKATQGAYVRAGTQIGTVSRVSPDPIPDHLHFAVYDWDGTKLRSRSTSLVQHAERPNIAVTGNILINNKVVNRSPWPVYRNRSFTMDVTVRNNGSETMNGNVYLILTRNQNGSQYVGKVNDAGMTANLRSGSQLSLRFTKSSFSSPAGTYFLQLYYDDGSGVGGALKRVSGTNPIAIKLL